MLLAQCTPLVSRHPADTILNIVERTDARQRFVGDRGWLQLDHIMELAAHMRHAGGLDDLVAVELLVTTIAIGMHHTAEVCEMVGRMRALAVGAIVVGNGSGSGIFVAATIEDVDPDPAGFGPSSPWVENIDRGIIRMYSVDRCDMRSNQQDERRKQNGHTGPTQSAMTEREMSIPSRSYISDRR